MYFLSQMKTKRCIITWGGPHTFLILKGDFHIQTCWEYWFFRSACSHFAIGLPFPRNNDILVLATFTSLHNF